jgi:hypothetical protein
MGLLLEERYDAGDPRFVAELRKVENAARLEAFVERMKRDPRPFVREQILAYLSEPLDRPGHQVVVKRLFKHACAQGVHEIVGAFLVAFDRLVRRELRRRFVWADGEARVEHRLRPATGTIPLALNQPPATKRDRFRHDCMMRSIGPDHRLFSAPTRGYLRRRAWRYFRFLCHRSPAEYVPAIAAALARYTDEDLAGEAGILDCPGLMQICFSGSDAVTFGRVHVQLRPGRALSEVQPAPRFPERWRSEAGFDALLGLASSARSRPVRTFALKLLQADHARSLSALEPDRLRPLLGHPDPLVNEFAAALFAELTTLDRLPVAEWLALLSGDHPNVTAMIALAMQRKVTPERIGLADAVRLALATTAPVARLGLHFLGDRQPRDDEERLMVSCLAGTRCAAAGFDIATWALARLDPPEHYRTDDVIEFFDAGLREVRDAAWAWLSAEGSRGARDPVLFARLTETPFEDVRLRLIDWLDGGTRLPGTGDLRPIWTAVLLGVHRGGRQKQAALRQLADAVIADPETAPELLPVIAVAVRSVRVPERSAGLAALVRIVTAHPGLASAVAGLLPEVAFTAKERA